MAVCEYELGKIERASIFWILEQEYSPFEHFLIFGYSIIDGNFGQEMGATRKHDPAQRGPLTE